MRKRAIRKRIHKIERLQNEINESFETCETLLAEIRKNNAEAREIQNKIEAITKEMHK